MTDLRFYVMDLCDLCDGIYVINGMLVVSVVMWTVFLSPGYPNNLTFCCLSTASPDISMDSADSLEPWQPCAYLMTVYMYIQLACFTKKPMVAVAINEKVHGD